MIRITAADGTDVEVKDTTSSFLSTTYDSSTFTEIYETGDNDSKGYAHLRLKLRVVERALEKAVIREERLNASNNTSMEERYDALQELGRLRQMFNAVTDDAAHQRAEVAQWMAKYRTLEKEKNDFDTANFHIGTMLEQAQTEIEDLKHQLSLYITISDELALQGTTIEDLVKDMKHFRHEEGRNNIGRYCDCPRYAPADPYDPADKEDNRQWVVRMWVQGTQYVIEHVGDGTRQVAYLDELTNLH